jgi:hypothetical protein
MRFFSGWAGKNALRRFCGVMAAVFAVTFGGCSSDNNPLASATLYPVSGKVLLPDGKPLSSGHIVFVATKTTITARTTIESDGSFTFKAASGDGLPDGEYKIRIEGGASTDGKAGGGKSKSNLPFDGQFLDEDMSKLTATVTSDETKNNFELKLIPTKSESGAGTRRGGR